MKTSNKHILTGNQAAAFIAYKTNEICPIYPITPATEMAELVEAWSAENQPNVFGDVPTAYEMQSEAGVAGAMHGAIQTGALTTTFTASQGLLLMMPNMYRIAAELSPNVIHVATRSLATQALSVFGDHSDVMAVRDTGYAFLGAANVQETMDFALIAQAATLQSRIPFVHFFDGFRTSHEYAKIEKVPDEVILKMMNQQHINDHRGRALNPNQPVLRGSAQGPDTYFQNREATNNHYNVCPFIVQQKMDEFYKLTGRKHEIFEYYGHPEAQHVIIAMGSSTETIVNTLRKLNKEGHKIGLIKVKLFRPFSQQHLIDTIPASCKNITVLDRTKSSGGAGEPLYLDVVQAVNAAYTNKEINFLPSIIGGRYGLSSKEFTPAMVKAIVQNAESAIVKTQFTIGINDDVTNLSLDFDAAYYPNEFQQQAIFTHYKTEVNDASFRQMVEMLAADAEQYIQGFVGCDYFKSSARNLSHLRMSDQVINAPYLIQEADFVGCISLDLLLDTQVWKKLRQGGRLLVDSPLTRLDFEAQLDGATKDEMLKKKINLILINGSDLRQQHLGPFKSWDSIYLGFLAWQTNGIDNAKKRIIKNLCQEVVLSSGEKTPIQDDPITAEFSQTVIGQLMAGKGDQLPVSAFPADGTYDTNTAQFNHTTLGNLIPVWDASNCNQCGICSVMCPQAALRINAFDNHFLSDAPVGFEALDCMEADWAVEELKWSLQINPQQCNGCNLCIEACENKALTMENRKTVEVNMTENWDFFNQIPQRSKFSIDPQKISQQQMQTPLYKYANNILGCSESIYLKMISQLFGDRAVIANATGATSISGGAIPSIPWTKTDEGRGPAWSNSLFEDNAEFGLGFRLSIDQRKNQAKTLLKKLSCHLNPVLVEEILIAEQQTEKQIEVQRQRIALLKKQLHHLDHPKAKQMVLICDDLVKQSVWIVGGDGWAYDIGYGGLDHVIASGENVNILVLDNELYGNTGGQVSKSTPLGASGKFAAKGKKRNKKDLGLLCLNYDDVYIASVAIGADPQQCVNAFVEAEQFDGPSVIVAYCHSPSHGIDTNFPAKYHRAAVDSGQWLLYRNDPCREVKGLNVMQLDSNSPSIPIEEFYRMQGRFNELFAQDDEHVAFTIAQAQRQIDRRYNRYMQLANYSLDMLI